MNSNNKPRGYAPRIILTVIAIFTAVGSFAADFNDTHVYNPTWPGHAKFHNGQTMSLAIFLSALTLWHTWAPPGQDNLLTASIIASGYYVTQLTAFCFPGSTAWDPPQEFSMAFPQAVMIMPVLGIIGLAFWLEKRGATVVNESKTK